MLSPVRILVTSALPYANGDIHFGQLAGAYLPADIYVKYHRLKGSDIVYICGSDEHGVPITLAAAKQKLSPKDIIDRYHNRIKRSFEEFGIEFDNYSRTSLPIHYRTAQDFFSRVYKNGFIKPGVTRQLYCPSCRMFLADRYVEGICPYCGSKGARGDQCEKCGRWIEPSELIEPRCKVCGAVPEVRETRHWFFALSQFQESLRKWLGAKQNWKPNVKRFCEGWFKKGLKDRPITRDLSWGVPVPLEAAKGKVMYVWFDAPIGYISSTKEWAERIGEPDRWKDYWLDSRTKLVHFIGKDNIVFHAVVWPAMLMAHGDWVLPTDIPANEFLNIEGRKFSTSHNRAAWLPEYLQDFPPDPLRYALAVNLPENRDVDFAWRDFHARNNNELADVLGNFVNRVAVFLKKNYNGRVPEASLDGGEGQEVLEAIAEAPGRVGGMIDSYRIKEAARAVMTLPALGNRYFDRQAPWRSFKADPSRCDQTMAVCTRLVSMLEILLYPFLPFTSRRIGKMLGLGKRSWDDAALPVVPKELKSTEILFEKLDKSIIEVQTARLRIRKPGHVRKGKAMISFDDFKKLELRTAKIVSAGKVPGTEKLVKMIIDIGGEERQIVAGIGKVYESQELAGKTIIVVANLAPAKIRGVESNGMLLAAIDGDNISLLTVDRPVSAGSEVS
ncbi:methionine--tRNA ligase [candidate division WOR-3 bacterium JGI_Cruoil_03_51_56]|uniref:Methionine--tRNA ligase n=1 Tax=candidate division WOR-3 bacterium JGI_Cruoil_03_51_56 TaxID=1973747 RepID=A0A235BVQ5_UNCW3|nr:MAG: methionine--tRNA ligase [candidate division WOR-3 bacterium JGI_Cruoil_03_51_56]